jgi:hypothetical protein
MKMKTLNLSTLRFIPAFYGISFSLILSACDAKETLMHSIPRSEELPLFQPHVSDFPCKLETMAVPTIDAQANQWFYESLALDSADIYVDDKDYKSIVQLMQQASKRRHWKAMLNLASLYIERRDPTHGIEDAVLLVEEALRLGVPAAYDRMGIYYLNGTGIPGDSTMAYAFMQKAAHMGNAGSMNFLAEKMRAGTDGALPGYWSNIPVAIKMFECALSQGYGPAGYYLSVLYAHPGFAEPTEQNKARALAALHRGSALGCQDCANHLYVEFSDPISLKDSPAPYVDRARTARYGLIADALSFDSSDRFPNLDRVLPLPPAALPPWNGDRDTLLYAARGVTLAPSRPPTSSPMSQRTGRYFLDPAYALRATTETATGKAPFEGYWQPQAPEQSEQVKQHLATIPPGLFKKGEDFGPIYMRDVHRAVAGIVWQYHLTIPHDDGAVVPRAPKGMTREMAHSAPLRSAPADDACPATGIWQPWLKGDHPLHALINQPSWQSWVVKGKPFPHPQRDWHLPITEEELSWHLLDASGTEALAVAVKRD